MNNLKSNKLATLIYSLLVNTVWFSDLQRTSALWWKFWEKSCKFFLGSVTTKIHGRQVLLNYGHVYPIYSRKFSTYNNPLIELVYQSYCIQQSAISLVDVGANIGDTILLLEANCPQMLGNFYCIEGDPQFFAYLKNNLGSFKNGELLLTLLSSSDGTESELIRTHLGTASAQGKTKIHSSTLDSILLNYCVKKLDVLKTDVDGMDGKILRGAREVIKKHCPAVIFEWHPSLCEQTANSWKEHFEFLEECGYSKYIWFDKYGNFSHFMEGYDRGSTHLLADLCLNSKTYVDLHYDVIALHQTSLISHIALAELAFAKARKSVY